ncbi:MAG: sugar phosphate nucleotidyltransferase, partial [Acidimicrobiia bacterium]|nr:sugar phosphate nucleotidyltransferase [Acidimicrobiia bacterium]
ERGEALSAGHTIASFVEKPDVARAEVMVESGRYLWNAGLFVGRAGVILDEASRQRPDLVAAVEASLPDEQTDVVTLKEDFLDVVPEPFDKAVMESTQIGVVIPLRAGWSDVGSWQSVWQAAIKDTEGNSVIGAVVVADSRNSYVSGSSRPVVVIGVEGVAVVETEDGILVMSLDRSHDLRSIVERLPDQHGDTSG